MASNKKRGRPRQYSQSRDRGPVHRQLQAAQFIEWEIDSIQGERVRTIPPEGHKEDDMQKLAQDHLGWMRAQAGKKPHEKHSDCWIDSDMYEAGKHLQRALWSVYGPPYAGALDPSLEPTAGAMTEGQAEIFLEKAKRALRRKSEDAYYNTWRLCKLDKLNKRRAKDIRAGLEELAEFIGLKSAA